MRDSTLTVRLACCRAATVHSTTVMIPLDMQRPKLSQDSGDALIAAIQNNWVLRARGGIEKQRELYSPIS